MKRTQNNCFRVLALSVAVYGLILTGLPISGIAQSKSMERHNSSDKETVLQGNHYSEFSQNPADPNDARGGNRGGGKKPPLEPTPTPTPAPTPPNTPTQWEIAGMNGVKFYTDRSDWYRVPANELQARGFDTNTDSSKWQLFSDGIEVALRVNQDGSVEFFGNGTDEQETDSKAYFLINGNSNGKRINQVPGGSAGQTADAVSFTAKAERNDRISYATSILNGEQKNWFGSVINSTPLAFSLDLRNLASSGAASISVRMQGYTYTSHLVTVKVNNYSAGTMTFADRANYQETFNVPVSELTEGQNLVTLQSVGGGSDFSLVDGIRISFPRTYQAINNKLSFTVPAGQTARVGGFSESDIRVYEINGGSVSQQLLAFNESLNGTYGFSLAATSTDREFLAVSPSGMSLPKKTERNSPSFWNLSSNAASFVIIAPRELSAQAQALADRRISQGMQTKVVLTEDIGDEFGAGIVTSAAVRSFLARARSSWQVRPSFVLLFGDSSYDMRNYLGGQDRNMVPTRLIETFDMETASDAWLSDFNDDGVEDIPTGRLPVATVAEATVAVAKIVRYETQNLNEPQSALLAADYWFEILNSELQALLPTNMPSQRVERMSLGDPEMRSRLLTGVDANPTLVTYSGHGTTGGWTTGQVLRSSDAPNMTNQKLSFYMLMTCLNGFSHNLANTSLAESVIMSQNGAIAAWASSGSTYASGQVAMGQRVVIDLFPNGNKYLRIGEIVHNAKLLSNDWDARRTWQLFGDPTVIIK